VRSFYITRDTNPTLYFAFKKAGNTVYKDGDSYQQWIKNLQAAIGCKILRRDVDSHGYFHGAVIEFDRDSDYTMFLMKWAQ
jgi:hypothetical protein